MEAEKLIEKLSQEQNESSKVVRVALAYAEFASLVRKMREAQKQWKDGDPFDGTEMELAKRMQEAEKEVDEYLKKMEE
jgi:hypothetical protein